jgi:hypothetical protein
VTIPKSGGGEFAASRPPKSRGAAELGYRNAEFITISPR